MSLHRAGDGPVRAKRERTIGMFMVVMVTIGLSAVLGNYAAIQMAEQTMVKNSLLCQILFLAGLVAGCALILAYQTWDRNQVRQRSGED